MLLRQAIADVVDAITCLHQDPAQHRPGQSDADAHMMLAVFLATVRGQKKEAMKEGGCALRLDPISQPTNVSVAWLYVFVHEYSQADARARWTLELYPGSFQASCALGLSAIAQGNDAEAIAALEAACAACHDAVSQAYLAPAHAGFGRREPAERLIAELLASRSGGHIPPKAMIVAFACLGENDAAFEWLERAHAEHDDMSTGSMPCRSSTRCGPTPVRRTRSAAGPGVGDFLLSDPWRVVRRAHVIVRPPRP